MANRIFPLLIVSLAACLPSALLAVPDGAQSGASVSVAVAVMSERDAVEGACRYESGAFLANAAKSYFVAGAFDVSDASEAAEVSLSLKSPSGEEELVSFDVSGGGVFPVKEALPRKLSGEFSVTLSGVGLANAELKVHEVLSEVAADSDGASGESADSGLLGYVSWFNYCNSLLDGGAYKAKSADAAGLKTSLKSVGAALGALYVDSSKGSDLAAGTKEAPKATIAGAMTAAQSGQVVVLESGTHVWGAAASGKTVTIRPNGSVTIRGAQ